MKADDANVVTGTPDKDYNLIWYVEACLARRDAGAIRYVSHEEAGRRLGMSSR